MAVCEFCSASVLKDAGAVKDIGKMSSVLEDFTPIQIGTSGVAGGRQFTVVGRIQLKYDAGMWNEWYLWFDDGVAAWLGDSSGLYTITTARKGDAALPKFDEIEPGKIYSIGSNRCTASEKRIAQCVGGQGELPFKVGEGYEAKVADFRTGANFVTLDYSDGDVPVVYSGVAITLEDMKCQLLRDDDTIKASAGKYRGKLDALDCPQCGSMIKYLPGVTTSLVCPACTAQLDAAGPEATVLAAGEKVEHERPTIALGSEAKINGADYTVIGFMKRADDEGSEWTEYLLYNARQAFFWLVETEQGWFRANVMSSWPNWTWTGADHATLDKVDFAKLYDYRATVRFAAGAFNWRVAAGDEVRVYEFKNGSTQLAAELTKNELTWSRSVPVAFDQVKAWFGANLRADAKAPAEASAGGEMSPKKFIWWLLGLNAIPLLFDFGSAFGTVAFGFIALIAPALYFMKKNHDKDKGTQQ
jgi:hypothetical protein